MSSIRYTPLLDYPADELAEMMGEFRGAVKIAVVKKVPKEGFLAMAEAMWDSFHELEEKSREILLSSTRETAHTDE